VLKEETLEVIRTLARYNACLKRKYGVDLDNVGEESAVAWEHFIASAQKGLDPESAVYHLANVVGLIRAKDTPYTLEEVGVYNGYRLALMNYAEENGLEFKRVVPYSNLAPQPVQTVEGREMVWDVKIINYYDENEKRMRMHSCVFRLCDPFTGEEYCGPDIKETLEKARKAVLKAENSFNQRQLSY